MKLALLILLSKCVCCGSELWLHTCGASTSSSTEPSSPASLFVNLTNLTLSVLFLLLFFIGLSAYEKMLGIPAI